VTKVRAAGCRPSRDLDGLDGRARIVTTARSGSHETSQISDMNRLIITTPDEMISRPPHA
jgi:hypothetical protein